MSDTKERPVLLVGSVPLEFRKLYSKPSAQS